MRDDWVYKPLGEVCNIVGGGTPSKRNPWFYTGNIPWATVRDMRHERLSTTEFSISEEAVRNSSTKIIPRNNVVIATRVGLGKACVLSQDTAINQDLRGIVPKTNDIDSRFLFRWFQSIEKYIEAEGTGATVKGVKLTFVKSLRFPIPPLAEQKRIVAILDEALAGVDTAIANTERSLANARELNEVTMENLISGCQISEKILADIVSKECSLSYGIVQPGGEVDTGLLVVRPVDLGRPTITATGLKRIDPSKAESYKRTRLRGGELLLCVRGTTGIVAQASEELSGGNVTRGIVPIRFLEDIVNQRFGYYLLRSAHVQSQIRDMTYGAALMQINIRDLRKIRLRVPEVEKQSEMITALSRVETDINDLQVNYHKKLNSLGELKQSFLQKAFSGELTADNNFVPISSASKSAPQPKTDSPEFAAHIMAVAYRWHDSQRRGKSFGRVKAQKTLHLVESLADMDMGREPQKEAAGPHDSEHMRTAEDWARENEFFEFVLRDSGDGRRGYDFVRGKRFNEWLERSLEAVEPCQKTLNRVVRLILPMNTKEAELVATVYAAWNNLLLDGTEATEAAIVREARDNWHPDKQKYSAGEFRKAIGQLRESDLVPRGAGKRVSGQESLLQ